MYIRVELCVETQNQEYDNLYIYSNIFHNLTSWCEMSKNIVTCKTYGYKTNKIFPELNTNSCEKRANKINILKRQRNKTNMEIEKKKTKEKIKQTNKTMKNKTKTNKYENKNKKQKQNKISEKQNKIKNPFSTSKENHT